MTGTSIDAVDAALVEIDAASSPRSPPRLVHGVTLPIPEPLREALNALCNPGDNEIERMGRADAWLGEHLGDCALTLMHEAGVTPIQIVAIGSHGQTIRHRPNGAHPFTLQIGDPSRIAERTGCRVVADIRRRDVAAGGQGAPLAPGFHEVLFRSKQIDRAVVNIGGLANVTLLPKDINRNVIGFDTGPGNTLMDAWIRHHRNLVYDADGSWAATGVVDVALLAKLQSEPYFVRRAPKSTGRELFNMGWLTGYLEAAANPVDVQRTLLELTASTIVASIKEITAGDTELILCGGGRHNTLLCTRISALLGSRARLNTTEALGWDGDYLEAGLVAWIAAMTINGLPANLPAVTGARGNRVLGAVFPA